jgi:hypothetical protein
MKAVIYGKVNTKFKVLLIAAIGVLAAVITLGELGII